MEVDVMLYSLGNAHKKSADTMFFSQYFWSAVNEIHGCNHRYEELTVFTFLRNHLIYGSHRQSCYIDLGLNLKCKLKFGELHLVFFFF